MKILVTLIYVAFLAPHLYASDCLVSDNRELHDLYEHLRVYQMADGAAFGQAYTYFSGILPNGQVWTVTDENFDRSDIQTLVGQHAAYTGWDFYDIFRWNTDLCRNQIIRAYSIGMFSIFSFHMNNPVTGGNYLDTQLDIESILPEGEYNEALKRELDRVADFFLSLKDENGNFIPVIFRPWHEMTGNWFWWGRGNADPELFSRLWQYTVKYLRDERNVPNLLFAFSTDRASDKEYYLEYWPGDEWVDICGIDVWLFDDVPADSYIEDLKACISVAQEKNKIAALTEIGTFGKRRTPVSGINDTDIPAWWTSRVLEPLRQNDLFSQIAFIYGWANWGTYQYHVPYPGSPQADTFKLFLEAPEILLLGDEIILEDNDPGLESEPEPDPESELEPQP